MDEDEAVLQPPPGLRIHLVGGQDAVLGQQAAAADAVLRIALLGDHPLDQLDPRPHAAGILPAAARAPQPLAQDGPSRDEPSFVIEERPGQRPGLPGGPHARGDQGGQEGG